MDDQTSEQQPELPATAESEASPETPPVASVPAAPDAVEPEVPHDFQMHPGFWQRPSVVNAVSFGTSLLIHIAIIAVGIATAKAVQQIATVVREQIIIPDATIIEGAEVGGIPNPGLGGDPTREAAQDQFTDVVAAANSMTDRPSQSLTSSLMGGGAGEGAGDSVIGIGAGKYGAGTGTGTGRGSGVGSGTGDSGGGALAPFGVPGGGGGIGPKSPFMGVSGNAKIVVYACDASGSMTGRFDALKYEIRKAVDSLKPIQAFDVIFFKENSASDAGNGQLLMAHPENKRRVYRFLDEASVANDTDPLPALRLAFKLKPQLVYLLTDGDFPDNATVLAEIGKLNQKAEVKINTILFANPDGYPKESVEVLQKIASENGGLFKFVDPNNVGG